MLRPKAHSLIAWLCLLGVVKRVVCTDSYQYGLLISLLVCHDHKNKVPSYASSGPTERARLSSSANLSRRGKSFTATIIVILFHTKTSLMKSTKVQTLSGTQSS